MKASEETGYRLERKFFISGVTRLLRIMCDCIKLVSAPLYEPRWINNIYFDAYDFDNYFTSYEGITKRAKVRIRWYGELCGGIRHPVLELKI